MGQQYAWVYHTEIGSITITVQGDSITAVRFGDCVTEQKREETPLSHECAVQLDQYLLGQRREFHLPLAPRGTDFQQRVWAALRQIPYGETRSYKEVAAMAGCPLGCRAVGMANNRNPIAIIVPCHRVIGADGAMVGYGGGMPIKVRLLELEGIAVGNNRRIP